MLLPGATAESTLYQTSRQYRAVAGTVRTDVGVQLADSCFDRCIDQCIAGDDSGLPTSLLVQECTPVCRERCHLVPWACEPGTKLCFRTGFRPHCCPETHECCQVLDPGGTRYHLECCPPGQTCCFRFGCYAPGEQQCTEHGFCPAGNPTCHGYCCNVGEVCTLDGCSPPDRVCLDRRCAPGEVCTPQGCCPSDRATLEGCCPAGQTICQGHCCQPNWSCSSTLGCCPPGRCCETAPCEQGRTCCGGMCCPASRPHCRTVEGTSELGCHKEPAS
jgi:hypothetical protein